jgi:hypothetical protein
MREFEAAKSMLVGRLQKFSYAARLKRDPIAMGQLHQPDQEIEEWHLNKQWVMYNK